MHLSLRELLGEAIEEAFGIDSRIVHTARLFLLQPGQLTRDYLGGRRQRYTSPLKLYLVTSAVFFLVLALRSEPMEVNLTRKSKGTGGEVHVGVTLPGDREQRPAGWLGAKLSESTDKLLGATPEQRTELVARLHSDLIGWLAKAMFALVPFFAGLLALLFRRAGRFYVEHLVFAMHLHAFGFLLESIPVALRIDWLRSVAVLGIVAYLFVALRAVYGEGRARTLFKLLALLASYGLLLTMTIAGVALISLVSL